MEKDLKKATKEIKESARAWTQLTAPIAAFGVAAVASFQKVEAALNKIRVGTGATGNALKSLQNDFRAVAANSTSSLDTVATAVADLNTKLGLVGDPLQQLSAQMTNLSKISGESISGLADSVSRAFNIAKVSTEDYESTLDRLFTTSQNTGVSVTGLATTFAQFQPILAKLGYDINTGTIMLGSLEKSGYSANSVMSALQSGLAKLAKAGIRDNTSAMTTFIKKIQSTTNESEKAAIASKLFGGNAQMMLDVIKNGSLELENYKKSLWDNVNSINNTAKSTETLSDKWQNLTNSFAVNGSAIGQSLNNLAGTILDKVATSFTGLSTVSADSAVKLGIVAVAIGPLQMAMSKLVGIASSVVGALKNFAAQVAQTKSFVTAFSSTLTGPAGLATALTAVAGVILGVYISSLQAAQKETAMLKQRTDEAIAAYRVMTKEQRIQARAELDKQKKAAEAKIQRATAPVDLSGLSDEEREAALRASRIASDTAREIVTRQEIAPINETAAGYDIVEYREKVTDIVKGFKKIEELNKYANSLTKEQFKQVSDIISAARTGLQSVSTSSTNYEELWRRLNKSGSNSSAAKKAQEELRKQAEADRKIMDSIKSAYSDEDWNYQHKFTSGDEYFEQLKARFKDIEDLRRTGLSGDTAEQVDSIWKETVSSMQSFGDQFAGELKEKVEAGTISMRQAQEAAKGMVAQFTDNGIPVAGSELDKLAQGVDKAKEAMNQLNQAAAQTLGNLKTGLIDAIVEGGNLADTLSSVGKQLIKIALNSMITPWFNGIFKGLIGGAHTGGVIGIDPPSFVRSLPKFHSGGIVGANEQLSVLQKGEAVFTKEQQKALGGLIHRDSTVKDVTINITNNGSGNMTNEQAQTLAKQIKAYVKTEVADEMYTYNRNKMYAMG